VLSYLKLKDVDCGLVAFGSEPLAHSFRHAIECLDHFWIDSFKNQKQSVNADILVYENQSINVV
jgi:hypothetical protein